MPAEKPIEQRAKANMVLTQAACLMDDLLDHDPDLVSQTWIEVLSGGPGWARHLEKGE